MRMSETAITVTLRDAENGLEELRVDIDAKCYLSLLINREYMIFSKQVELLAMHHHLTQHVMRKVDIDPDKLAYVDGHTPDAVEQTIADVVRFEIGSETPETNAYIARLRAYGEFLKGIGK